MRRRFGIRSRVARPIAVVCFAAAVLISQVEVGCAAHTTAGVYRPIPTRSLAIRIAPDRKVLPPQSGLYTGIFTPPAPFEPRRLDAYVAKVNKPPAVVMWYQPWVAEGYGQFKTKEVEALLKRGMIPLISWEPWDPSGDPAHPEDRAIQPKYRLSTIVAGKHDAYIRSWAKAAAAVDGPIMLRPMHEMNGTWYPWSELVNGNRPGEYVEAWKHIHDIFIEEGATNVTWVWSVNHVSVPNTYANRFDRYYPGAAYVDWTAISGFNWGVTKYTPHGRTFDQIYADVLRRLQAYGKPIVISEIACNTEVNKPAWIRDSYYHIFVAHHEVNAVVWFDQLERGANGTQDWRISSSAASEATFRTVMAARMCIGASPTSLLSTAGVTP